MASDDEAMAPSDVPADGLDEAVARLYGLPLGDFVAERNALAKRIRGDGDRELATAVAALRKPTVVADAINRALRRDRARVERLLDAVADLRSVQEAMLAGGADETGRFAAAQGAYRAAVEAVVDGVDGHQIEVRAGIEAAAIGGLHRELRDAAFAVVPELVGGFGPFVAGTGILATSDRPTAPDRPASPTGGRSGPSAAERRLADRARQAAETALAEARAEHDAAIEAATSAAEALEVLDRRFEDLSRELEEARAARDRAVADRARAEANRDATAAALDEARAIHDRATAAIEQLDP